MLWRNKQRAQPLAGALLLVGYWAPNRDGTSMDYTGVEASQNHSLLGFSTVALMLSMSMR